MVHTKAALTYVIDVHKQSRYTLGVMPVFLTASFIFIQNTNVLQGIGPSLIGVYEILILVI